MVELKILISLAVALPHHDGSQLWHSNFDDVSNLKLFVFLEDVTEDSGPLEVLSKSLSGRLMKDWGCLWGKRGVSHNDAIVPSEQQQKILPFVLKWRNLIRTGRNKSKEPTERELPNSLIQI